MKAFPEYHFKYFLQRPREAALPVEFSEDAARKVRRFHRQLPGYRPTRLIGLNRLSDAWGVGNIFVKDESTRFDLKAFKVLGGSYAVARLICQKLGKRLEDVDFDDLMQDGVREKIGPLTLTTATDGNHGRGVAWAAEQFGQQAVVYMPKGSARSRVNNIRSHGAVVEVTDLNYDDTVRLCRRTARKNGWHVVQDTAWEGYTDIPLWIMQGYLTMCAEATGQMARQGARPTHVFVQAGVGALAGAVVGYFANKFKADPPRFIMIEPVNAACFFKSMVAGDGRPHAVTGDLDTIMVGLACGEPSPLAWGILRDLPCCYVSCDNYVAANGIRILANPLSGDDAIVAGESGAVGMGLLDLMVNCDRFAELRTTLEIGPDSTLLFFNTEGATDPENYREILWHGRYPSPF
jgi:diaminopropionate ammonia-lyase